MRCYCICCYGRDIDEPDSISNSNIYVIDGKYSELQGKVVMPYELVGSDNDGKLFFYSVANDGSKLLLKMLNS